jgi:hypothetical protein
MHFELYAQMSMQRSYGGAAYSAFFSLYDEAVDLI